MIAPTRTALAADLGLSRVAALRARRRRAASARDGAARRDAAAPPSPREGAAGLETFLHDGSRIAWTDRARSAARAFSAGDGYVPGQLIDRLI